MLGRGQFLFERARGAGKDADGGVDVDGGVGDAIELHLMIHHLFAIFAQQEFASDAKVLDGLGGLLGGGGELRVSVVLHRRTGRDAEEPHGALCAFLSDESRIGQRVLDFLEQRPQVTAGELETRQRDEETQDVVGALEDAEDAQISHPFLQTGFLHEAHAAEDLDGFVRDFPRALRSEHFTDGRFDLVFLRAVVHVACGGGVECKEYRQWVAIRFTLFKGQNCFPGQA